MATTDIQPDDFVHRDDYIAFLTDELLEQDGGLQLLVHVMVTECDEAYDLSKKDHKALKDYLEQSPDLDHIDDESVMRDVHIELRETIASRVRERNA